MEETVIPSQLDTWTCYLLFCNFNICSLSSKGSANNWFNRAQQQSIFFTQLVKSHWWSLVPIAIGIIALQINNWNDRINDLRQEKISLENLLAEQQSNLDQLQEKITGCQQLIGVDTLFLSLFDPSKQYQFNQETELLINSLASPITFDPGNGVMNDLINSGKINLIRNDSLKYLLSEWQSEIAEVKEAEHFLFEFSILPMKEYLLEKMAIRKAYQEYIGNSGFEHDSDLFEDRKFENLITSALLNLNFLKTRYITLKEEMELMIGIIKAELSR